MAMMKEALMARTFWADCPVIGECNRDTAEYLEREWGVKLLVQDLNDDPSKAQNGLGITVRDYPEIMLDVENSGYFQPQGALWQISRISPDGITLYLVNYGGKSVDGIGDVWEEAFVFIPMSNVIAIHNISQRFFINESVRSIERQEKKN